MAEPDYDILVNKLRTLATENGGDPNDVGRLTRVALKYAKNTNRELDPTKINDALFKAANIDPTTGQAPLPQETWGQTASTALERGANAAMQFGNAAIGNTEGTVKRMLEQDAIDAERAGRQQSLAQTAVGEVGSVLANPLTYAGAGLSKYVVPVAQAGYQGLERFRQGAVASEDNLASKSLIAGAAGGLGAIPFAKPVVGAAANLALGGGQEVAEATIDNREVDPLSLGIGAVSQVAQSAGSLVPNVVHSVQNGRKTAQVNLDEAQAQARVQADAVAAQRAQAASDRRLIDTVGPKYDELVNRGVDAIRGADPLPDPFGEGVLPARDAIELNKLRDEVAQQELDAEQIAATQKLEQERLASVAQQQADAEALNAKTVGKSDVTIDDVKQQAQGLADVARMVVNNRQLGRETLDTAMTRLRDWRKQSIDNIAQGNGPLAPPKIDDLLGIPAERNVQVENADMQARQSAESNAVRPLREATAEVNTATLSAEIERLRAENEALRKPRVTAEQQAIESDQSLADGEAAVAPDRQLIANADKAIRRAEYDMTGKTSRVPVAESAPATTPVVEPAKAVETPKTGKIRIRKDGVETYENAPKYVYRETDPVTASQILGGTTRAGPGIDTLHKSLVSGDKQQALGQHGNVGVRFQFDTDGLTLTKHKSEVGANIADELLGTPELALEHPGDKITKNIVSVEISKGAVKANRSLLYHMKQAGWKLEDIDGGYRLYPEKRAEEVNRDAVSVASSADAPKTVNEKLGSERIAVENPKIVARREKLKAEQEAKKAREEKLTVERTPMAAESVPGETSSPKDTAQGTEGWKVYKDPITNKPKATRGEIPSDAREYAPGELDDIKRSNAIRRAEESAKRDPWSNRSRSGSTSIPSMIADATVDLARNIVPSLRKIAETAGGMIRLPARLLAMDSKYNLDKVSAERIRQLEENTFRILDKHRAVIERANKATSFDFNNLKLANKLRDAINVSDSATGTSYRSDFLDMVEGRKPVTPELKPIVDAIWETNRATRQMAIDNNVVVGKGFRNGVGMVRFWNGDIVNRIANAGVKDPIIKSLFEDIAAKNNIPLGVVIDHFDNAVVIRDINKAEAIAKIDPQELARMFDYVPSHIKGPDGEWHPVLNLDPNSYVNRVTQTSTKRAAAKASFPGGIDKFMSDSKLSPGEKKELSSAIADFYGIYERGTPDVAFNHAKLVDFVTNATRIINNARLSASHAANITELTSMSMIAPPQYMMKGGAKYEPGIGGLTEGRGANTLDVSNDSVLRGSAQKVDRILRATGAHKIPTLIAKRMYSGIRKFYSDINGKTSEWTEHYMEMADLSQDLRQKFRDGTATPEDIDVATTKAMRVATGRDLLGTQKAGMEHNWFARVLGPPYRGYSQKTIRNMWKATTQAFDVVTDSKIPVQTRAGIAASSLATAMVSQGINAASYNALRAVLAGSFAAALYELKDRSENLNLQNFAWITSNIIGGGPIGTMLEQSSKEGNVSLQSGAEMLVSPYSAASAIYKAYTGGTIVEGAAGMVPIVNKARKLASGEGKIEFAKNQFYRVVNEIEGRAIPNAAEQTPLNAASKSLRNAIESGSGEQEALRELVSAAKLEAKTRRVDFETIVYRKLDSMRTIKKYEEKLTASESPEDRKKLREMLSRIPDDIRRELIQFDRKVERLKLRFEPTE